jgi:hypothetical protein
MVVRANGAQLFRTNLLNLDGGYAVNNEYNLDIPVNLPAGKQLIEIANAGADWFFLDSIRLERALPADYANNWEPSCEAVGLHGPRESLLYVVAPLLSFPGGATNESLPIQHAQTVSLTNWSDGNFVAEWFNPATGAYVGFSKAAGTNGMMELPLPDFTEDLASILFPAPTLMVVSMATNALTLRLDSELGSRYVIEKSADLSSWSPVGSVTNVSGTILITEPLTGGAGFFRALSAD